LQDGLYVSTDGGKSFAKSPAGGLPAGSFVTSFAGGKSDGKVRLFCVMHKNGWAGITGGDHGGFTGVFVLDVGKDAWVKKVDGIPPTAEPFFVKMAANDADTAYIAGGSGYPKSGPSVFKTINGGENWTDIFLTGGNKNIVVGWAGDGGDFQWSFPEYALGFEVSLLDKNRLLLTDLSCAHASDDGGKTWRAVYTTLTAPRTVGSAAKGASYASNGMDMTSVWQLHWFDEKNVFACTTDIKGSRSTDSGKTWSFNYTWYVCVFFAWG